ncbi:NAD(P)H-hydrate dehydratase [Henriciella litoralis]|uniref:NAD(P)H-hydrate dehydratase n=1 Tax=Henriciella litoralis TaxID=568102 RepID=UPI000A03857E|nr:NAD(P)H-hydrate dehydratase [Henriciella litoralis]
MAATEIQTNSPDLWLDQWPWPDAGSHKHKRGHLGCVTGSAASTGAARLAARAGLRIGAGLVTLLSPPSATLVNASVSTAVMVKPFSSVEDLTELAESCSCALIGPAAGVKAQTRDNTLILLESADSCVLDADALTVFSDAPEDLFSQITKPVVLTPHEGEFKRIFPDFLNQHTREKAVRLAAKESNAIVILKGAETLIAAPDGRLVRNTHASPFLATAGSGDVLAGLTGGLMAQGMDAFLAACAACWTHGELGLRLGPGLISEDLPDALPALLKEFYATRS